ncbi:MAG TPA: hypothetical protein VHQ65_14175 [Thermoanaerobaculia bacterium]|nr:hypothetical protein [Thermoanaerobaculia bacterium]
MALYHSMGRTLVSAEELVEKSREVELFTRGDADRVDFRTGTVTLEMVRGAAFALPGEERREFKPIGVGKPLTIRIASVYPGDLPPRGGIFGKARGSLVTSAVKSWQSFDMQPRALNILKRGVKKRETILGPAATEEGTPLVFYSPALVDRSLIVTFELAFDDVNEAVIQAVGAVFQVAAGLPVFVSAAPHLLAASALFRLGGQIANALFDGRAEFQGTENLYLDIPGEKATPAGFALITRSPLDESMLIKHYVTGSGQLVEKDSGTAYSGEIPYVVMALDGTPDPALETFSASAASAALLKKFYNVRPEGETDAGILVQALTFYNDFRYREQILDLDGRISQATGEDKKRLELRRGALLTNIKSDLFKP